MERKSGQLFERDNNDELLTGQKDKQGSEKGRTLDLSKHTTTTISANQQIHIIIITMQQQKRTVVVQNLARFLEIDRNEGRIVAVFFVARHVLDPATVAGIVDQDDIAVDAVLRDAGSRLLLTLPPLLLVVKQSAYER